MLVHVFPHFINLINYPVMITLHNLHVIVSLFFIKIFHFCDINTHHVFRLFQILNLHFLVLIVEALVPVDLLEGFYLPP